MNQVEYWDFSRYGGSDHYAITNIERDIIWQGAQAMIATPDPAQDVALVGAMQAIRARLLRLAAQGQIDPDWYANALLLMALEGLVMGNLPSIHTQA
jgi:hypothetical protein